MANGSHILGSADLKAFNGAVWQTANSLGCLQSGVLVFPIIPFVESFGRRFSQRERGLQPQLSQAVFALSPCVGQLLECGFPGDFRLVTRITEAAKYR